MLGWKFKIEEFLDIVVILEYEFGEGDWIKRGGGGFESYLKFENDMLYCVVDNKINMVDVRLVLLFLVFEDFLISFFCCYNYM